MARSASPAYAAPESALELHVGLGVGGRVVVRWRPGDRGEAILETSDDLRSWKALAIDHGPVIARETFVEMNAQTGQSFYRLRRLPRDRP